MSSQPDMNVGNRAGVLRYYEEAANALPEPGEKWRRSEVPEPLQRAMRKFSFHGIIHRQTWGGDSAAWTTDKACYQFTKNHLEPSDERFACGHRGMRKVGDDEFTCLNEHCDETFDRETAEAIFG